MSTKRVYVLTTSLMLMTAFLTLALSSSVANADDTDAVDDVSISVPISCSIEGTGMTSHNANIPNGTYQADIGTTTLKAFCNDDEGFAIYAVGYTGNEIGATNSTKLVGTSVSSNATIDTGTATTAGNPDVSNWAMKLNTTTSPTPTYPVTIDNSFNAYHAVPASYTKVAHRDSGTDVGQNAVGSTLTTTYAAYISKTQAADTYSGQVKYTLVHPSIDSTVIQNAITVIYDGNGFNFPNGETTNTVKYANICAPGEYAYVGNTPVISKTSNIANDGTMNTYNTSNESTEDTVTIPGAYKLKVELKYGYDYNGAVDVYAGTPEDEEDTFYDSFWSEEWEENNETLMTNLFILDGDTVTFVNSRWDDEYSVYDGAPYYGYYAKVYPVYETEQPGTTGEELPSDDCTMVSISGTYSETIARGGSWTDANEVYWYGNEEELKDTLSQNYYNYKGSTINLYAYIPYKIVYNDNNATAGTMDGYYVAASLSQKVILAPPNFYKTGYGFAGWSENQNATVNGNSKIYGPNETITASELTYDAVREANLYAVWVPSSGNLQNWNGCSSMSIGDVTALTDNRDNDTYAVAKLADNKCWMIENLRLDNVPELSSANTHNPSLPLTNIYDSNTTSNHLSPTTSVSYNATTAPTGWCTSYSAACFDQSRLRSDNTTLYANNIESNYDARGNVYSYGNYYNWYSATAGNGRYSTDTNNYSVLGDICPVGWHLPRGGDKNNENNNEFWKLIVDGVNNGVKPSNYDSSTQPTYSQREEGESSSNALRSYPNNFLYSGRADSVAITYRTYMGVYWSSTTNEGYYAYWMVLNNSSGMISVNPGVGHSSKFGGYSVRCLSDN